MRTFADSIAAKRQARGLVLPPERSHAFAPAPENTPPPEHEPTPGAVALSPDRVAPTGA